MLFNCNNAMALLPKTATPPTALLPDSHTAQVSKALAGNCCCRCMPQFKTRSALLRHLEGKLTDCEVAVADGGMDVPRSALVELA